MILALALGIYSGSAIHGKLYYDNQSKRSLLIESLSFFVFTEYNTNASSGLNPDEFEQALKDLIQLMPPPSLLRGDQNTGGPDAAIHLPPQYDDRPKPGGNGGNQMHPGGPDTKNATKVLFQQFDRDQDNELSLQELKQLFSSSRPRLNQ